MHTNTYFNADLFDSKHIYMVNYNDFLKLDIRIGKIIDVQDFPEARNPSYKIWIDFGDQINIKKSSAQLKDFYKADELLGRQVVAIINFEVKQIASFMSECLILAAVEESGRTVLLTPDSKALPGSQVR